LGNAENVANDAHSATPASNGETVNGGGVKP
jgi:hypothetical protein